MRTIYKYQIRHEERLLVPEGAKFLSFEMQDGQPTTWFEVETLKPRVPRYLTIVGTGHEVSEGEYLGTCQDPPFVWHLYERKA